MEQFRMIMAIVLSCIVFLGYNYFFGEKDEKRVVDQESISKDVEIKSQQETIAVEKKSEVGNKPMVPTPSFGNAQGKEIVVESSLYTVKIDTRGAVIKSFQLKEYLETVEKNSPNKELISKENSSGTFQLELTGNSLPGLSDAVFDTEKLPERVILSDKSIEIPFAWVSDQGVSVEKRYRFSPGNYLIGLDVTILNSTQNPIQDGITLSLLNSAAKGNSQYGFEGASALINAKLEQIKMDSIEKKNFYKGQIGWVSLQDRYFLTSIIPKEVVDAGMQLTLKGQDLLEARWVGPQSIILPQQNKMISFDLYLGPKKISVLKSFENGLDRAVDFGWFDFIARPCLWIMNYIHHIIPNYGIAIIILTVFIKAILWPLGQKSYKSMNQMKRMQPLMSEIREKYKNDKRRINEETMALYRTYKVNPLGGCLPMVAQIPVFFAFYRMLYEAVELRHAPFMGWVNDLSAPDRLFHINVSSIPFMEPPYGIPVLTIIMGATMFIQQKMQPPMGDPAQAKMMMFMPVIFTVIFINFSSGLVLYWLVNNILSIAQQYFVSKKTA
ncbi:MAG: membrane protein insertase YidC [Pseudomonadota bacterium]